ncbi:MAG: iron-sulfur cluster assembly accessory protein [Bacteroidetes bacterium]|nr:iron-sulfur cluster assembly accessory protein [Bacteroidota bacterium]
MQELSIDLSPIHFSETAIAELERIDAIENPEGTKALRLGAKGGGCAGFSYILEYDEAKENDLTYLAGGVKMITDRSHLLYIGGMTVDYESGLNNRGFIYKNPNAETTCGCGSSFG